MRTLVALAIGVLLPAAQAWSQAAVDHATISGAAAGGAAAAGAIGNSLNPAVTRSLDKALGGSAPPPAPAPVPRVALPPAAATRPPSAAVEVVSFERTMEAAVARGDVAYVDSISAPDLTFTHGDGWTTGGEPLQVEDRAAFLKRVEDKVHAVRDLDSVKVEMHGDIAITYGHYVARYTTGAPEKMWFSVWFERVYAKRGGRWQFVSHRTVHGPTYGPDRLSINGK